MSASLKANEPSMEEILASIRRIIADDTGEAPPSTPEPAAAEADDDSDVLDLATVVKPPPASDDDIEFREINDPPLLVLPKDPEPEPPAPPPAPPARPEPVADLPPVPPSEPLLSDHTHAAVSSAFSSLTSTILTSNARTLEDLVSDMMRPMLKAWLDQNLPALVERLVKAEIERVTRGPRS